MSRRGRARPKALAVALLAALGACAAPPPAAAVDASFGVVRAGTAAEARQVSDVSKELIERVRALVPGLLDRRIEVWVQPEIELVRGEPYPEHIAGMTDFERGRIHVRTDDARLAVHLAHELVHALLGASWRALPGVLEEGLCDLVAALVAGEEGREHHVKRVVEAAALFGGYDVILELDGPRRSLLEPRGVRTRLRLSFDRVSGLSASQVLRLDDEGVFDRATSDEGVGLYGIGYLVAYRIVQSGGFAALHELCRRAAAAGESQIPERWVLEQASIRPDPSGFRTAIEAALGIEELPAIAALMGDDLARAAVAVARENYAFDGAADFLARARPRLRLLRGEAVYELASVPRFAAAVHAAW